MARICVQPSSWRDKINGDNENRHAVGTVFLSMWSRMFAGRFVSLAAVPTIVLGSQAIAWAQSAIAPMDYSQEAVVVEQSRTFLKFDDDGTGRREVYMRLRTQSEAGVQQFGQLVFGYNSANERAEIAFVRVHKPDGIVVATRKVILRAFNDTALAGTTADQHKNRGPGHWRGFQTMPRLAKPFAGLKDLTQQMIGRN